MASDNQIRILLLLSIDFPIFISFFRLFTFDLSHKLVRLILTSFETIDFVHFKSMVFTVIKG
jgi:hypothetical protein